MKIYDDDKDLFRKRGSMKDLLERHPVQLTRNLDPQTSYEAGEKIIPKLRKIQQEVYDYFLAVGPVGATDLDLQTHFNRHGSTYRTRRAELVELGLIIDTGQRREQQGSRRNVWAVKS